MVGMETEDVENLFQQAADLLAASVTLGTTTSLEHMQNAIVHAIPLGNKLLICGNGGSAADAQHLAAELLVRLRPDVNRQGIPAIALTMDTSTLTAYSNDYNYDGMFERMVQTLGKPGDVLLGISTSGNSKSVVRALETAQSMGVITLGFLGAGGGAALRACDHAFVVASDETALIQIVHITAGHALLVGVEDALLRQGFITRATTPGA